MALTKTDERPLLPPHSLRLSETQWDELIAKLEAERGPTVDCADDRRGPQLMRFPFVRRAALRVRHPTGQATTHLVRTRNLSRGGIGLVHGCFLYRGTSCHVAIQTRHDESVALAGEITWCRHIAGKTHEVGICFSRLIQLDEFICPEEIKAAEADF